MAKPSLIHSMLTGAALMAAGPLMLTAADVNDKIVGELRLLGIDVGSPAIVQDMLDYAAMDAAPDLAPTLTTAATGAQLQFLQAWLPGFVNILTAARKIDELIGVATVGSWEDEEIVQGVLENTGLAQPYGDHNSVPLASWNLNYERRSIVRFEQGMEVGKLEERRSARQRVNTAAVKRRAAAMALEIQRNRIGFYGYNAGTGRTYGFFNDPGLPAYVNVANGTAGTPGWSTKTFQEITADIRSAYASLNSGLQGNMNTRTTPATLAIPTISEAYLSVTTDWGQSVEDWIKRTYPALRIVSAPELAGANGGVNVFYLWVDSIQDGQSDDDGNTWLQAVPTKFMTLGVDVGAKTYVEDYSNAMGGVMVKRPYGMVRRSGI